MTENLVVKCYDAPFRHIMIPLSFPEISHFHVMTVLYELKALTQFFGLLNEFLLQRNQTKKLVLRLSGGELLELRLLDTFGRKSIARHKIDKLFESSKSWLNLIRTDDENIVNCSNPVFI